jgi:hypothetical protein
MLDMTCHAMLADLRALRGDQRAKEAGVAACLRGGLQEQRGGLGLLRQDLPSRRGRDDP